MVESLPVLPAKFQQSGNQLARLRAFSGGSAGLQPGDEHDNCIVGFSPGFLGRQG